MTGWPECRNVFDFFLFVCFKSKIRYFLTPFFWLFYRWFHLIKSNVLQLLVSDHCLCTNWKGFTSVRVDAKFDKFWGYNTVYPGTVLGIVPPSGLRFKNTSFEPRCATCSPQLLWDAPDRPTPGLVNTTLIQPISGIWKDDVLSWEAIVVPLYVYSWLRIIPYELVLAGLRRCV